VEIVVTGRHTGVPSRFREHAQAKLAKLERYDHKILRLNAELCRERNPRLSGTRERVELTVFSRGPVIRAEAAAADPCAALDLAAAKLTERMRRAADRRHRHTAGRAGHRGLAGAGHSAAARGGGVAADVGGLAGLAPAPGAFGSSPTPDGRAPGQRGSATTFGTAATTASPSPDGSSPAGAEAGEGGGEAGEGGGETAIRDEPPMIVREKTHESDPMTLDDALSNMELVGHDFYLFMDVESGLPSVVYRRCGYDYGLIRLTRRGGTTGTGATSSQPHHQASGQASGERRDSVPTV